MWYKMYIRLREATLDKKSIQKGNVMKYSDLANLLSGAGQFLIGLASLLAILKPKKKETHRKPRRFK